MLLFSLLIIFLLGISIGSFLLLLRDRLPFNQPVVNARSFCPHCRNILQWYDLLPLISLLLLKNTCRYCKKTIGWHYFFIELLTGVLFVSVYLMFVSTNVIPSSQMMREIIFAFFIISVLWVVFLTDLKFGIIPDKVTYPAIVITFVYLSVFASSILLPHISASVSAFLFFFSLFLLTKGKGIGFGDIKFALFMGLLLGPTHTFFAFYVAFLTGACISLILVIWGKKKFKGATIPFGPFLVLGTFISYFYADSLIPFFLSYLL